MITAFIRTVILYVIITVGLRLMGKRQIGELEPGELVLAMMLSDLAAVPMQDFGIPLFAGIVPILTLLSLSMLLSELSLRSLRWRELLCGRPVALIRNGVLCQRAMEENRYTLDELMEELRGKGFASVSEVRYAVLENSGHLSVFPWRRTQPPSCEDLEFPVEEDAAFPAVVINDGRVVSRNLAAMGRDETWLRERLAAEGIPSPSDVFLLTLDEQGRAFCLRRAAS